MIIIQQYVFNLYADVYNVVSMETEKSILLIGSSPTWFANANCKDKCEVMYPDKYSDEKKVARAKLICGQCLVIDECKEYALDKGEMDGIWGGMTPRERKREANLSQQIPN